MCIRDRLPSFNSDVLNGGPDDLGLLMTSMGIGAILGSLLLAKMGNLRRKGIWLFVTSLLWGGFVAGFALADAIFWTMLLVGLVGFISAVNMSMNRSIVQLQVDQQMRGRVMSIDMMSHGLMPLGILPISWISEVYSVQTGLGVSGICLILGTILLWYMLEQVRGIDRGYERPN